MECILKSTGVITSYSPSFSFDLPTHWDRTICKTFKGMNSKQYLVSPPCNQVIPWYLHKILKTFCVSHFPFECCMVHIKGLVAAHAIICVYYFRIAFGVFSREKSSQHCEIIWWWGVHGSTGCGWTRSCNQVPKSSQ